jgi:hypothetical protein
MARLTSFKKIVWARLATLFRKVFLLFSRKKLKLKNKKIKKQNYN